MKHSLILAGVAALAISAPALSDPGKGGGGGNKGGGGPAKVERGGGGGGNGAKAQRGGGGEQRAERQQMRGPERQARPERSQRQVERAAVREARGPDKREMRDQRPARVVEQRGRDRDQVVDTVRADFRQVRVDRRDDYFRSPAFRTTGLVDGCPPGLAAKNNGCLPPGQAKKLLGAIAPAALGSALLPPLYRGWYPDNDDYYYRTNEGYVYRIDRDRDLVDGYWPLENDWSGAYYVGAAYPQDYLGTYNVPVQYQPWYADNGDDYYRYADGAIYQVDRNGGVIESIVSLLAGGLGVGQPLPTGYDAYNVPYDYRDQYVDSDDAWYRYNDGNIYQVDPTTRLVQAIVETRV